jgi:hypothetical protein
LCGDDAQLLGDRSDIGDVWDLWDLFRPETVRRIPRVRAVFRTRHPKRSRRSLMPHRFSNSTGIADIASQARRQSERHYRTGNWERAAMFGHIANALEAPQIDRTRSWTGHL